MPYFITDESSDCTFWAVVKEDGELVACHDTKESAQKQMVAISLSEGLEPGGTYTRQERDSEKRQLPDNYRPALAEDVPEGRACGNCFFYDESRVNEEGDKAWCNKWEEFVEGDHYCNAWQGEEMRAAPGTLRVGDFVSWNSSGGRARGRILDIVSDGVINVPDTDFEITGTATDPAALIMVYEQVEGGWRESGTRVGHKFSTLTSIEALPEAPEAEENEENGSYELREVNLTPPAYMRAAARRGLSYYEEGKGGDGLVERTIREARAMAAGNVTADKWVRLRAWIARHLVDLDSPAARPSSPDYPSAGVVAHLLWGSGPSKRAAQRALTYAEGVVSRLEAENAERSSARGKAMSKVETRVQVTDFEIRETQDGMTFSGYAAVFNSPSEPLPFREKIAPGAFRRSLDSRNDIKLLWNHDTSEVLASSRAKTLTLKETDRGLYTEALLPNTSRGRDTAELIRRGDVDSMSFGFSVPSGGDEWSSDGSERTLKSVRLHEVSIVAFPAYSGTAGLTSVRGLDAVATRAEVDADALADAIMKIEEGEQLSVEDALILNKAIGSLSDAQESAEEEGTEDEKSMLELKKKKLQLLLDRI
jgi:HK97 family phage prohead protease